MSVSPQASPAVFPGEPQRELVLAYAGFWWRVLAFVLDVVVLSVVDEAFRRLTGLRGVGLFYGDGSVAPAGGSISNVAYQMTFIHPGLYVHGGPMLSLSTLLAIAYFSLLESSRWQATVGKRVCRLRVTDLAGRRIGWPRALGRVLGKYVSLFLFGIGFLMVGWTRRKQGLHDMMAGTLVMRIREADPVFRFQPQA